MFKKATFSPAHPRRAETRLFHGVGRSERRGDSYSVPYGEPLSDARTKLADFFNTLLGRLRQTDASCCVKLRIRTNLAQVFSFSSMRSAILCIVLLLLAGCAGPRLVEYLPSVQGVATQADVKREIGPPLRIFPPDKSGDVWIYRELNYSHNPPFGVSSCVEYVLTFDRKQVLQEWNVKEWPPQSCR